MSRRGTWIFFFLAVVACSVGACGAESWRGKVAPSVLRWIDSGASAPRELLLRLTVDRGSTAPFSSYAGASHLAWWSSGRAIVAEVQAWAEPLESFAVCRSAASPWETGLPYVHALESILVRSSTAGARQLAQLGSVAAILDAAGCVPAPDVFAVGEQAEAGEAPSPGLLLSRSSVSGSDLGMWMATLGWRYASLAGVGFSDSLEMPLAWSATELALALDHEIVGLAVSDVTRRLLEDRGEPLAAALAESTWAEAAGYSPTVRDLACLVEAMGQAGADGVGIAPIAVRGDIVELYVLLRSIEGAGLASLGGVGESTTQNTLPRGEAPRDLSATLGSHADRVVVQWQPASGASSYEVLRSDSKTGLYSPIAVTAGNSYVDTDVATCVQYSYLARSIGEAGLGMESAGVTGYVGDVPMPPSGIWTDGGTSAATIVVQWTPVDGATSYTLMRGQPWTDASRGTSGTFPIYEGSETSFRDTNVIVGQTYFYRAYSGNGCGRSSALSAAVKGVALYGDAQDPARLNPPMWLEATRGEPYGRVVVSWSAVKGATGYRILRAARWDGLFHEVAVTSDTSWEDTDVTLCQYRWYRVQALANGKESEPSASTYGSYGYRAEIPQLLHASIGNFVDSIELTWQTCQDAASYWVLRGPAPEGPFAVIATNVTETRYIDEGLKPGQEFWYIVQSINPCGGSPYCTPVRGATASP